MNIQPWQAPLLVTAVIIGLESATAWALPKLPRPLRLPWWTRRAALLLLTLFASTVAIMAWGESRADAFISVFTGVSTVLTLLAFRPSAGPGSRSGRSEPAPPRSGHAGPS